MLHKSNRPTHGKWWGIRDEEADDVIMRNFSSSEVDAWVLQKLQWSVVHIVG